MARHESDREDLMCEATALCRRVELEYADEVPAVTGPTVDGTGGLPVSTNRTAVQARGDEPPVATRAIHNRTTSKRRLPPAKQTVFQAAGSTIGGTGGLSASANWTRPQARVACPKPLWSLNSQEFRRSAAEG